MKKILIVISNFNIGGPQKSLIALFDRIDYSIFDVDLLVLHPDGILLEYVNSNVNVIEPSAEATAFTLPSDNIISWLKVIWAKCGFSVLLDAIKELIKGKVKYKNVSVSRQHFWCRNSRLLTMLPTHYDAAFGVLGLSTYYVMDCVDSVKKYHWIRSDTRILGHDEELDSKYFKRCTGFLSVSKDCSVIFEEMYPFAKGKVTTFYNYIPEKFYESLPSDCSIMSECKANTKILTVCRLDPYKGLELALAACSILVNKGLDICWFVLGDGKHRKEVERMIKAANLEPYFILLGFQYNTLSFIKEADIIVHPSRFEGKSNAVDEALFCCKPTVVTNYATATEVIENEVNGIICEMSGECIAYSVERLMNDKALRESLSTSCRNKKEDVDANEVLLTLC